ncbi:MAG TPA: peptidyl-alpha-hydroxyglycine alpha-amidating lyase family protein [Niabella sp.]|nr:peptidyl-alpha-hydroxyglycine alpha-amidating lyase family protein [Niabella sp.]
MLKKAGSAIVVLIALLILSYFLQPVKKGVGSISAIKYKLVKDWLHLPDNIHLGNPVGIGIDTGQNIIIFQRGEKEWPLLGPIPRKPIASNTVLIINKYNGALIDSWGSNLFIMPHGLTVDRENNIWVTDVGLQQVFKFTHDGTLLMKLGLAGIPGNDSVHFNKPTDIAVAKDGSFYVSDGYGNSRVVKFSPQGKYLFEWGIRGSEPGAFNIPHAVSLDDKENIYVADRENNRIQIFDSNGKLIKIITDKSFGAIYSVFFDAKHQKLIAADDFSFLKIKHRGSDVLVMDSEGKIEARFGRSGSYDGSATWYHDLAIDNEENIYLCDILENRIQKFEKVQ